jgi:hypothetical protein
MCASNLGRSLIAIVATTSSLAFSSPAALGDIQLDWAKNREPCHLMTPHECTDFTGRMRHLQPGPQRTSYLTAMYERMQEREILCAYSSPNWTLIPRQTGHGFHGKVDTVSRANWTLLR